MIINKTLDFNDLNDSKAQEAINWFEQNYESLKDQNIPARRDGLDNYNRRYWEYFWATHNTPVEKNAFILDFGCGSSLFTFYLSELYKARTVGIDLDIEAIDECNIQKRLFSTPSSFTQIDILQLSDCAVFDAIFSISVIEHISDAMGALYKCASLLKNNGFLSITFDYHKNGSDALSLQRVNEIVSLLKKKGLCLRSDKYFHDLADYANLPLSWGTFGSLFFQKRKL